MQSIFWWHDSTLISWHAMLLLRKWIKQQGGCHSVAVLRLEILLYVWKRRSYTCGFTRTTCSLLWDPGSPTNFMSYQALFLSGALIPKLLGFFILTISSSSVIVQVLATTVRNLVSWFCISSILLYFQLHHFYSYHRWCFSDKVLKPTVLRRY